MRVDPRDAEHIPHIIGGERIFPEERETFLRTSPWDHRDAIGVTPVGNADDVILAVEAADRAFPGWSRMPAPSRGRILRKFGEFARQNAETIAQLMVRDAGKTPVEAKGEVTKGIQAVDYYDGAGLRPIGEVIPAESRDVLLYTRRFPVGVVGLITPWNFPWAVALWKLCAALAAGCTVVWKPSQLTPSTSMWIMETFEAAGLPPGVVNLVHGGKEAGAALVEDLLVQAISFTGSNPAGTDIFKRAAGRGLWRVQCEMGGKNAVIVMPDTDLEAAAIAIAQGAFVCAGQRCTATSRVIAHQDIAGRLTEMLVARASAVRVGPWTDPTTSMGPLSTEEHLARVLAVVSDVKRRSSDRVRLCFGGERITDGDLQFGSCMQPTIFKGDLPPAIGLEELFGPVLAVTSARDFDHAIQLHNGVALGHAGAIFTSDHRLLQRFVEEGDVGMVHLNEPTVGGEVQVPFGGIKETGIGAREMGTDGLEFFTFTKTVFDNTGGAALAAGR